MFMRDDSGQILGQEYKNYGMVFLEVMLSCSIYYDSYINRVRDIIVCVYIYIIE